MYNPGLWPAGIFVRRYFEARRPRANNDNTVRVSERGRAILQQGPIRSTVGLQGSSQASAQQEEEDLNE